MRRNPLVRNSNPLNVLTPLGAAILLGAVTIPAALTIGISIHRIQSQLYAQQVSSGHMVAATALSDSTAIMDSDTSVMSHWVPARWNAAGTTHTETINWPTRAKAGDWSDIWVDTDGVQVQRLSPLSKARADAVWVGVSFWVVVAGAGGVGCLLCWQRDRSQFTAWEHELATGDGKKVNESFALSTAL